MKKLYFKYLNGFCLFAVSVFMFSILGSAGFSYSLFKNLMLFRFINLNIYFLNIAIAVDRLGNAVAGADLFNDIMIKEGELRFGDPSMTISKVLGINKISKKHIGIDDSISDILNTIEPNHVENAAKDNNQ